MTVVRVTPAERSSGPRVLDCLGQEWSGRPTGRAALRIGVDGASVTVGSVAGRDVRACDATPADLRRHGVCGVSYGLRRAGRLRDPRLDFGGCSTADGSPIAFAWIEPRARTRYVAVQRPGWTEVYRTAAGLPVRVATTDDLEQATSSARFEISEYSTNGRLIGRYELRARTAG